MSLLKKLHTVQSSLRTVAKSGKNTFSKYDYCKLGDFITQLKPLLEEQGLVLTQSVSAKNCSMDSQDNGYYTVSEVTCTTSLYDIEDNDAAPFTVESVGFSTDKNGDKAAYKAATGARKYGLAGMFNMEWDSVEPEDDEFDDKRFTIAEPKAKVQPVEETTSTQHVAFPHKSKKLF